MSYKDAIIDSLIKGTMDKFREELFQLNLDFHLGEVSSEDYLKRKSNIMSNVDSFYNGLKHNV